MTKETKASGGFFILVIRYLVIDVCFGFRISDFDIRICVDT